jgi:GNAT superfamily N-acetyltransferase
MDASRTLTIVFDPATGRQVSRYVVRGFFGWRELPQAMSRMLLTREFLFFVGIPLALLAAANLFPAYAPRQETETISLALTVVAVVWLTGGLVRISRYGKSSGIGCYAAAADGSPRKLVGGLRMRLDRHDRRMWIAGLLVEPQWRGSGIATALMLAAFRLAEQEAADGPVSISVFAPTHPASKAIIARQLGGLQVIEASSPASEEWNRAKMRLKHAIEDAQVKFEWNLPGSRHKLF